MEHEGPPPLAGGLPVEKRRNAVEKFRHEHLPQRRPPKKLLPEKVNQNYPELTRELQKRQQIRKPTIV